MTQWEQIKKVIAQLDEVEKLPEIGDSDEEDVGGERREIVATDTMPTMALQLAALAMPHACGAHVSGPDAGHMDCACLQIMRLISIYTCSLYRFTYIYIYIYIYIYMSHSAMYN